MIGSSKHHEGVQLYERDDLIRKIFNVDTNTKIHSELLLNLFQVFNYFAFTWLIPQFLKRIGSGSGGGVFHDHVWFRISRSR